MPQQQTGITDTAALLIDGRLLLHHRILLAEYLRHIDYLDAVTARLSVVIGVRVRPQEEAIALIDTLSDTSRWVAAVPLAEIVVELGRLPSAQHLASWVGMCPEKHESAGKRTSVPAKAAAGCSMR